LVFEVPKKKKKKKPGAFLENIKDIYLLVRSQAKARNLSLSLSLSLGPHFFLCPFRLPRSAQPFLPACLLASSLSRKARAEVLSASLRARVRQSCASTSSRANPCALMENKSRNPVGLYRLDDVQHLSQ
jgi:hypothetical protein